MRKAFNFYKSYYDVACELSDKDRLLFYDALIKKQFTGIDTELKGMASFAYLSQKFNIDSQVLGYESKTGVKLSTIVGGSVGGSVQEKEKEKEKEKGEYTQKINKKDFETRKADFIESLSKFKNEYSNEMLNSFFRYWSEKNTMKDTMRFEDQKYFEISKRLITWKRNSEKYEKQ